VDPSTQIFTNHGEYTPENERLEAKKKHLFEKEHHLNPKPSAVQVPAVNFSGCSLKCLDPSLKGLILAISMVFFHGFPLLPVQKNAQAAVM